MAKPAHCIVEGCPNASHAKGYCRRHYGQIWRRGHIYNDTPREKSTGPESGVRRDDRLKALERELKKAQQMYEVVVGFQGRIKWRREIEAVQHEIRKLTEAPENVDVLEMEEHEHDEALHASALDSGELAAVKAPDSGLHAAI